MHYQKYLKKFHKANKDILAETLPAAALSYTPGLDKGLNMYPLKLENV